jgi:hypothetical protein
MLNRQFQAPGDPERRALLSPRVTSPALILLNILGVLTTLIFAYVPEENPGHSTVKLTDSQFDYCSEWLAEN